MNKCKITVLRRTFQTELVEKYAVKNFGICQRHYEGQVFYTDHKKPEGFCDEAWKAIYQYVFALAHCKVQDGFYYRNWIRHPGTAVCSCNDGLRPVIFLVEATDIPATPDIVVEESN